MFLSPFALFALAALAIPAILHLWRPPPATVRVGTLKFFSDPAVRRLTKLRWRERLLLAVRVLLLTCVALLLAQPIWKKAPPAAPQRWALIEPGVVLNGDALQRWRELDDAGFETRELSKGFPPIAPRLKPTREQSDAPDVWSLLREVDARLPVGSTIAVFASNRFASLHGERPAMKSAAVEWISSSPNETLERTWLRSVHRVGGDTQPDDELRVEVATSNATRTQYIDAVVQAAPGTTKLESGLAGWSIEVAQTDESGLSARLLRDDNSVPAGAWTPVTDREPLHIALLHSAERAEDARYVKAATLASAEALGRAVVFGSDAERADWVLWLNDEAAPPDLVMEVANRGATLLSDAENSREGAVSLVTSIEADALNDPVRLFRRVPPVPESGVALWTDGFGTPLLAKTQHGNGRWFRFFSRFHSEWNDLPRSSALAVALQPLLFAADDAARRVVDQDQRRADANQARPAEAASAGATTAVRLQPAGDVIDPHSAIWMLCVALFAAERVLSHFRHTPRGSQPKAFVRAAHDAAVPEHV